MLLTHEPCRRPAVTIGSNADPVSGVADGEGMGDGLADRDAARGVWQPSIVGGRVDL